ncbi:MAG: alpha/beta hydrolase, partial [Chloroflexota bacterium]
IGFMIAGRSDSPVSGLIALDVTPQPPLSAGMQESNKIAAAISRGAAQVASVDPEIASGALVRDIISTSSAIKERSRMINKPVLLIQGERSHAMSDAERLAFLEDMPHADVLMVDSGHLVARDQPEAVAAALRAFVSKI